MEDVTPDELRAWRQRHAITQEKLGERLGLKKVAITKIENGQRHISQPEQKLIQLLMRGKLPFSSPEIEANHSQLEFTQEQWTIIQNEATQEGYSNASDWIVHKIRSYLQMNPRTAKDLMAAEANAPYNKK